MANISKIKLPNNTTYTLQDDSGTTSNHLHTTDILSNPSVTRSVSDKTLMPLINEVRANHLAFLPGDQVIVEKTIDGGATWTDYGMSNEGKARLFTETDGTSIYIPLIDGQRSFLCGLRVTITGMKYNVPDGTAETEKYNYWNSSHVISCERYCSLSGMYFWLSSSAGSIGVTVQRATGANSNSWSTCNTGNYMTGWSGNDYLSWNTNWVFGGAISQTTNFWNWRITFMTLGPNGSTTNIGSSPTSQQNITQIRGYGPTVWTAPNNYMKFDHMYTHDYFQNVTFPKKVTAIGGFSGDLTGTATKATTATNVSTEAGTTNINRHVWFSNSDAETKRAHDDDFMYNPYTNVLTVGSITGSAAKVNNHTVLSDVPANAVFTDTTYSDVTTSVHGLMTAADKVKLNKYPLTSNSQNGYLLKVNSSGNVEVSNITVDTALTQSELDTVLTGGGTPASYYNVVNRNDIDAMTAKLVELNAPTRLTSGGTEGTTYGAPPLVLLHFSDIHGDSQRVQNIVNFKSYYANRINDIICTGDIVNYSVEDGLGFWTGVSGSEDILTCIGNHDSCMVNASDRTGSNWMKYTMSECFSMYMSNISSWGATYTSGKTYYYKDYTTQGVRLIVLDIMRNQSDSTQITWFTNTLTSARTAGLHVIVALHGHAHWRYMPYDTPWDTSKLAPGKLTSQDHYEYYPAEGYAYMGGTSSWADKSTASRGTDDTSGYPSNLGTSYMEAVQDFIDAGGNFVCWLHGHTHYKMFARLLYFPDQLDVSVAQAGCPPFADSYTNYREEDTRTEDDFELVAVDTESKILRIAQVGIDHDKYMRPWDSISYNYGTHELMSPVEDQQTDLLFEGTFKQGTAAMTLANAMRYKQLVIVGKSGAATSTASGTEYRINSVRTITTSTLTTSAANSTLTGSDGTFTFSLKYSGSNIVVTYVSETTAGKGAITSIYGHM